MVVLLVMKPHQLDEDDRNVEQYLLVVDTKVTNIKDIFIAIELGQEYNKI